MHHSETARTASSAEAPASNIDQKLERLTAHVNRLEDLIGRARSVLKPALTPESIVAMAGAASGSDKAPTQSPMADRLSLLSHRLERHADDLRDLLDRVEA